MIDKELKKQIIDKYKQAEMDTGSVEIQIALLTKDIESLATHFDHNKKDFGSKRGLLRKVSQRKKYLNYLQRKKPEKYTQLIQELGLRK